MASGSEELELSVHRGLRRFRLLVLSRFRFFLLVRLRLLLFLLLLAGSTVGLLTQRRTESDTAGYVAFAVVVGYVPGVWFGGLL